MQVAVENTGSLGRRVTISLPPQALQAAIVERMDKVALNAQMDGFRKGKVPKKLLEQKYGSGVRQEAISNLIETSLPKALQQEALEPAGLPEIEKVMNINEEGKDFTYVVRFEVMPEVAVPDFKKIKVDQYTVEITEADIDKARESLRDQLAHWTAVDRPSQKGDRVTIDYESTLNGKPYENSSGQNVTVELGSQVFIEGFEEGLLNVKASTRAELDLRFPSDWRVENLASKPVHFVVNVKTVEEKELAALDETFAKKIGAENATLPAIQSQIRRNLEKQAQHLSLEETKKQVLDKLLTLCQNPLPKALIEKEMSQLHAELHKRGGDKATASCHHHGLEEEAKRRIALSLILRKIVKLENLTPDKEKVREHISAIAKGFGNAEFIENMYYESEELIAGIQNTVLVDQVIDLVLAKASKTVKPITLEALLKRGTNA